MSRAPAPWVLLRGLMREQGHWGDFPDRFAETMGTRPVLVDLPGNGERFREESPARVADMAQAVRDSLGAQNLTPPYRVLALSLGAMVTTAWAQQAPEEIETAVLVNTSLRPLSPFYRRLRPAAYPTLLRVAAGRLDARGIEQAILKLTTRSQDVSVLDHWLALRDQHPVSTRNALRQLLAAMRYQAPQASPFRSLLLICSAADGLVHPDCSRSLAQRWNAALSEHPTAGHDLPFDDAEWLIDTLRRWAERVDAGISAGV